MDKQVDAPVQSQSWCVEWFGSQGDFIAGKAKEPNWLPAPNDTIYLVMRLYWPKTEAPSILPAGNGSWKPPSVVKVT